MVTRRFRVPALTRKLLRDVWAMKGQAFAIAAVVAAGVTMFVTYLSNFDSLRRTLDAYYASERLADVFAAAARVPEPVAARLAVLPGVTTVETRVVADVVLDLPGLVEPASGRLVSLPRQGAPRLNAVRLRRGAWPDPARPDEVIANEVFCEAHGFGPGDRVVAIVNGRRRHLVISGVGLSPEFVYSIKPGELFPDNRRYGIFWMGRDALAAAFDMTGAFNDVSLALAPSAVTDDVVAAVDRVLTPYGGRGAFPRALQMSAWTLGNELTQLEMFGLVTPAIFLSVAAFILHIALSRALALQRAQIAALKALGYGNRTLAWHYVQWALAIAAAGALAGIAAGAWLGGRMALLYNEFFRFPSLDYHLAPNVAIGSLVGSLVVAAVGAQAAVRRAVRLPPAEAMRAESPGRYRPSLTERLPGARHWPPALRMVLRTLERQPVKATLSTLGIAAAGAVLVIGFSFLDVMEVLIAGQFSQAMRQDVTITFATPRGADAAHAVARLPGVFAVETERSVAARLSAGARRRTVAITGLDPGADLHRVVARDGRPVVLPPDGLVLSQVLGRVLGVGPGAMVTVDLLEGHRRTLAVPVAALVDDSLGVQAYMHRTGLHRLLREGGTVTTALLRVDPAALPVLTQHMKGVPAVAGVAIRDVLLTNFRTTMAEHMNLMIFFNVVFAGIIAFGVVYNAARVSLSERARELASLRVLGFTRAEVGRILVGELALLTLASLPIGLAIGTALGRYIMTIFDNEVYRLPFAITAPRVAWSWLTVLAAAALSALAVRRRLDRLDLVGVLKSRE